MPESDKYAGPATERDNKEAPGGDTKIVAKGMARKFGKKGTGRKNAKPGKRRGGRGV